VEKHNQGQGKYYFNLWKIGARGGAEAGALATVPWSRVN